MTGFIGRVLFFFQPGQLGFQVAYPLEEMVQLGGHALVRPADVAEESLRHDGSLPPCLTAGVTLPCHRARLQTRCIACGGEMEKSTSPTSLLRVVFTAVGHSEARWPPPDAPREAVSSGWAGR